jgi:dTDP-glucose 4,6-dehydratase
MRSRGELCLNTESILVTGAAGFVGANLIRMLLDEHGKWEVTGLDACTYAANVANLAECFNDSMFEFIRGDICDLALIDYLMSETDVVVNVAAETNVDVSMDCPGEFLRANVDGTRVLLDAAVRHGIRKFIHISTCEVYGPVSEGACAETDALWPVNPYAATKAAADVLAISYFRAYGLPVVILRSSENYGPYQFPDKMIPLFITRLLEGERVPLYGDGQHVRDWLHVQDHCSAITSAIERGEDGNIYNLASGHELKTIEVTRLILRQMGRDESAIEFVDEKPGHERRYSMGAKKAVAQLEWRPQVDFERGLKDVISWYTEHQDWWKRIISGQHREYYEQQFGSRIMVRG